MPRKRAGTLDELDQLIATKEARKRGPRLRTTPAVRSRPPTRTGHVDELDQLIATKEARKQLRSRPTAASPAPPPRKKHGGGGILGGIGGFAKNLAGDVEGAAVGVGPGLVEAGGAISHDTAKLAGMAGASKHSYAGRAAREPWRTGKLAKTIGQSYRQTYGPLLHGDVKQFARNVYEHPLGPILDALTVVTAGAGGVAKAGKLLSKAGVVSKEGRLARLGEPGRITLRSSAARQEEELAARARPRPGMPELPQVGATVTRRTSRNPAIRARQHTIERLLRKVPYETPVVGEEARFWRAARREPLARSEVLRQQAAPYMAAFGRLSEPERQAFGVLARVPLPEHLDAWKQLLAKEAEHGGQEAAQLLETLNNPKVLELYQNPTERMMVAHAEAQKLGERSAAKLQQLGVMTKAEAEAARYRHSRIAAGADVYTRTHAKLARREIAKQIRRLQRDQQEIDRHISVLRERGTAESRAVRAYAGKTATMASRAAARRQTTMRLLRRWEERRRDLPWGGLSEQKQAMQRIESTRPRLLEAGVGARQSTELVMLEQARADIASRITAGRAEIPRLQQLEQELAGKREAIHSGIVGGPTVDEVRAEIRAAGRPEPIYTPDVPVKVEKRAGAGGGGFSYSSPVHRTEGVLFATGRLALEPDVLGPNFLRVVEFARYREIHGLLLDAARRVPTHVNGQPYELQAGEVYVKWPVGLDKLPDLNKLLEDPTRLEGGIAEHGLTTETNKDAYLAGNQRTGHRYVVSAHLARQAQAEFARTSRTVNLFLTRPTAVWRALVLNLRVGWLTGNVVGNSLLYALRYSGPRGLKAYLNAVRVAKGPAAVRELLNLHTPDALTPADIAELLPEQAAGTFIGSQAPASGGVAKWARRGGLGLAPADRAYEGLLRRAAAETELRRSPEVRARLKAMPKETRSFRQAAREELEQNPELARHVSAQVNSALGDFLSLGPFERRYVRAIAPFYAWYKAITTIAFKLPLDYPGRADLLERLGQIALEQSQEQLGPLPTYLKGAIPLGGDRLLKTGSLNPFSTVPQLYRGSAAGLTNPYVALLGGAVYGAGAGIQGRSLGDVLPAAATEFVDVAKGLPEVRLALTGARGPQPSKVYQPSALDELLAYLGAPTKTINRPRAAWLARHGR
jgi:hypothetical protein